MNEKTKILIQIFLAIVVAGFALLALTSIVFDVQKVANEPIPSVQSDNLCYWKTIQPGQGISESGPGEYSYTLIMTSKGIDVYLPCK